MSGFLHGFIMSPLALPCLAFAAAIFAANFLPSSYMLVSSALLMVALYIFFSLKGSGKRIFVKCAAAYFAGLLCFAAHWFAYVYTAEKLDGSIMELRVLAKTDAAELSDSIRFDAELSMKGFPSMGVIVYDDTGSLNEIKTGQYAVFTGKLRSASMRYGERYDYYHTKGQFLTINVEQCGTIEGEASLPILKALRNSLIERVDSVFSADHAVFMRALMTGDKDTFYDDLSLYTDMSRAGLMHIVAVSGMHISILMSFLCIILGRSRTGSIACIVIIWIFVLMTGASPSAVRAGIMNSFLLMAVIFGRESDVLSSLSIALALILFFNPFAAASVSLQLSFTAVVGIVLTNRRFRRMGLYRHSEHSKFVNYLVDTTVSSVGVIVFTTPLTAAHFGSVNLLSPISNVLCLWAVTYCFCFAYIACILPSFLALIAKLFALAASLLCDYICMVAKLISEIPFATVYTSAPYFILWIIISYMLIVALFVFSKKTKMLYYVYAAAISSAILAVAMLATGIYYGSGNTFSVIDVGQGQSVVAMSGRETLMVDCGNIMSLDDAGDISGQYLLGRGRRELDLLILTHLHTDHADGVAQLMEFVKVKRLVLPAYASDDGVLLAEILSSAAKNNVSVSIIEENSTLNLGSLNINLYTPRAGSKGNENCMFVRISAGEYDCMISADNPMSRERELVRSNALDNTELVIVGHHGSRYSSSEEYLSALGGETAIISCGYNTYGHPTEEVLERLEKYGYNILRTDLDGNIEIRVKK